jgi:hypothetical protein
LPEASGQALDKHQLETHGGGGTPVQLRDQPLGAAERIGGSCARFGSFANGVNTVARSWISTLLPAAMPACTHVASPIPVSKRSRVATRKEFFNGDSNYGTTTACRTISAAQLIKENVGGEFFF